MSSSFLFTSESVSEGHPDKVADQISDAILDAILAQDKYARVAAETLCNTGLVVLAGEITSNAVVDYQTVARETIKRIGYDNTDYGIDYKGCAVLVAYDKQSPDIAQGVDEGRGLNLDQGAGDQGLMFGYACDETPELMPLPIYLAHRLVERQAQLRKQGKLSWLRPDAKSQVTIKYVDGRPKEIDTVVLSTQHHPEIEHKPLTEAVIEEIIKPVLPKEMIGKKINYLINPTGRFVVGGPQGDCGLTGRKIIVDTYGGAAPHGGGAFSGKDPSKVDRSAAYAARYVAKNIVAVGPRDQGAGAGVLRHRRREADQHHGHDLRHRQGLRREARGAGREALRPAPEGHRADARPAAPDLPEDRGLRPFRPQRAGVHLGKDRQGRGARGRCRRQARGERLGSRASA